MVFSACRIVANWFAPLLGLLAPRECAACAGEVARTSVFCQACGPPRPAPEGTLAARPLCVAGVYTPPLSTAIRRFKFEGRPELAGELAGLLTERALALALGAGDAWVPVPLHRARLVERGFNQAALVAGKLARRTRSAFFPRLLERTHATEQQARLDRDARAENVRGAFRVRPPLPHGRVVLVDDVVTTGSTAEACIAALSAANIEVLAVYALARAGS